jgi:hypothetical protein
VGLRDDKHFKSINVKSFWYKTDPFILAQQGKEIFYLQDTTPQWSVSELSRNLNIYDVAETEQGSHEVHWDDYCSETEHVVEDGENNEVMSMSLVEKQQ